jgi:hypothetical protein
VFGDAGYDFRRDLLEVVGGMGAAYQDDLEAARERCPNGGADAHLGEKAGDGEVAHSCVSQQRLQLSPLEAVVATLSQQRLVRAWLGGGVDRPAGGTRLVASTALTIVLEVNGERAGVACGGEQLCDASGCLHRARDGGGTVQKIHLCIDHQ